jgi:two-component system LytT family sensor kinase
MRDIKSKWRLVLTLFGIWTTVGIVFSVISYLLLANEKTKLADALRYNLVHFYLWAGLSLLLFQFSRRFRVEFNPLKLRNLLLHIPILLTFAAVHQTIHIAIFWYLTLRFRPPFPSLRECYRAYFGLGFYLDVIIAALIVIAVHAILYYRDFRASELEQSLLRARLAEAQLRALKMQLHPHFLFNTLHSISSLVLEDAAKANNMIARLGDFLRLTLDNSDQQMVTLKEEMEFLHCYLEIEQVRFGDRLTIDFEIEATALSGQLPHLILQPVVENAVQHAIAPRIAPGRINIEAKRLNGLLRVAVTDTGPGSATASKPAEGHGLGLSNVRARLRETYGTRFRFETENISEGGLKVIMEVPFNAGSDPRTAAVHV